VSDLSVWPRKAAETGQRRPGTTAFLGLFLWNLVAVFLTPPSRLWLVALLALLLAARFYPASLKRLLQPRWLLLLLLLALPSLFVGGTPLRTVGPLAITREGVEMALGLALRATVVLVAVDGFSASVSIGEVAALCERAGLPGVGFAVGVALNLLPILRRSLAVTWHSLRLRGGWRRHPLRCLRYFLVTSIAGAVMRAGEIALAAEARAYDPDHTRPAPLRHTPYDRPLLFVLLAALLALRWLP
jgi:energy-coupling factor transporter transmembrane protein EcfT